jgi:3-hydroxybutyryl-CoA dehydratase
VNEFVFAELSIGHTENISIVLSQSDVDAFMELSDDRSAIHVDDEYARSRGFEQRLVHGVLISAYISQLIGMLLPGKHGVLRGLSCEYRKPCYSPNLLFVKGSIVRLVPAFRLVGLSIEVRDKTGAVIATAKAETVMKI